MAKFTRKTLKKVLEVGAEVIGVLLSLLPFFINKRKK